MVSDIVSLAPPWLIAGVLLGVVSALAVGVVFYLGDRLFPGPVHRSSDAVDGAGRRRTEIREYLTAIDEQFIEDHPVADERVAFYLPDRDVAITFDAHAYFRLERAGVFTVLCEHELPGRGLGQRLPFAVPDVAPASPPADDPVAAAFDELGIPRSADESAIKSAYRRRVKDVHPDQGGDEEAFKRVREAYTTARNHCPDTADGSDPRAARAERRNATVSRR